MQKQLHHIREFLFVTIVGLTASPAAFGQAITGRLVGTVEDKNQAAVSAARVTVTNQSTGISSEFQTDSQGNYIAPSLPVGDVQSGSRRIGLSTDCCE